MAEKEYRRLTRARSRTSFGIVSTSRASLWLGKDHLLCIDTNGYTEHYKRFYFRDIQAVIIRKTIVWHVWSAVLAAFAGLFALIAILGGDSVMAWVFGCIAGLFVLALLINILRGPTCSFHMRTAVQVENFPSVHRLRVARHTLKQLRPLIAAAQGQLPPEDIPLLIRGFFAASAGSPAASAGPGQGVDEPNAPPRIIP
jgi:uncharacterized membrane protein required for colicin V production